MGVRGKVEAVIYAAEEPVTLAQLVTLFGEEALAERVAEAQHTRENMPAPETSAFVAGAAHDQPEISEAHQAHGEPVSIGDPDADKRASRLRDREVRECILSTLHNLMADYSSDERGMELREIAGGYRIGTKPEYHEAVRTFVKSQKPVMKLTLQALETLAIIAYKQPVTAPEVAEIRGVDSGGVLGSLVSRKLVTTAGRKPVVGRPILYKTTKEFLLRFGLKDLAELPSMEEFEKMAGELVNPEDAMTEESDKTEYIQQLSVEESGWGEKPAVPGVSVMLSEAAMANPESMPKSQGDEHG